MLLFVLSSVALYLGRKMKLSELRFILFFEVLPIDDKDDYYAESARPRVKKHYIIDVSTCKPLIFPVIILLYPNLRRIYMYYQIYDTRHNKVIATCPTQEDAYSFLRLYEAGERTHLKIHPIFKSDHPLRKCTFRH